jgi:hypothetical protein
MISQLPQIPRLQSLKQHARNLADYFPVIFFFAGFIWDALTIGRNVMASDLAIFTGYLLSAALILYLIGRPVDDTVDASAKPQARLFFGAEKTAYTAAAVFSAAVLIWQLIQRSVHSVFQKLQSLAGMADVTGVGHSACGQRVSGERI